MFIRPMTPSSVASSARLALDLVDDVRGQRVRRQRARRVARVDAGLLDVLHHAADHDRAGLVGDDVDVELDRVVEELVDQQREPDARAISSLAAATGAGAEHALEVVLEPARVVDPLHRAAAEHVARAHHHREPDLVARPCAPRRGCGRCPSCGARSSSLVITSPNRSRSSARSIASALVPRIGTPASVSAHRELERRLAAELDDHAPRLLERRRSRARPRA